MGTVTIMIVGTGVVVAIAVAVVVKGSRRSRENQSLSGHLGTAKLARTDIRSKVKKCRRCGGPAHGMFGTENTYRCRMCGYRFKASDERK